MIAFENILVFKSYLAFKAKYLSSTVYQTMKIIKKTTLIFSLISLISLISLNNTVFAEASNTSAPIIAETIKLIEDALVQVNKSDFSAAQLILKSARFTSAKISGDESALKEANNSVIQGQIYAKSGDIQKSADELEKALKLYKTL